jgi:hypothetical protein
MDNLITAQEFAAYRNISKKLNIGKIDECIKLAQSVDLFDILGEFLFDVIGNKDEASYADLMSGSTFTVSSSNYIQEGIKSLLADYAYGRYLYAINTNQTSFGLVQKINDDSTPIDRNMIKDMVKLSAQDASIKFRMIDKYLLNNTSTFTRYSKGNDSTINTFSQNFWVKK